MTQVATANVATAPLLPAPMSAGTPEMQMLVLMVQSQLTQGEVAKSDIHVSEQQLKDLREQVREALQQAREAEEDSGFFGKIGDVLGGDIATLAQVVAIAAATVVSCGTAAVVLASVAIACTLASKYGEELGIPPKVAMGLGVAAALSMVASGNVGGAAGAVTKSGSAAAIAGASVAPGVAAGTAVSSGGVAATALAASKVTWVTEMARDVGFVANIVAPSATAAGTGFRVAGAFYHHDAIQHDADAKQAQSRETLENLDIDAALDVFERTVDRQLSMASQTQQILESNQQSHRLIIQGVA